MTDKNIINNNSVIYARVSTREQEETGYSLESQKKLLTEYSQKNNLNIKKVFIASESASGKKDRQTFQEMLTYVVKENINHIICEKTDRLTRNPKDAGIVNDWINNNGNNKIHFVKESFIADKNTKAHEGLVWNMKVSIAKFYTDNLSEEVKKGNAEKIRQGWIPCKAKIGYKTIGESGHKTHVPDEFVSVLIIKMFNLYSTGLYSLQELGRTMNKEGLKSKSGKKISKSNLAKYLSDPFYYGEFLWNDKIYKGNHEPLITKSLFDQVQRIKSGKTTPKYSTHEYLFKGKIICKECGGVVTWEKQKGHVYGHCNKYRACTPRPWYKEEVIDKKIESLFGNLKINNSIFSEWLKKALKESNADESSYRETSVSILENQLKSTDRKLDNLYEDRLDERINIETYDRKAKELKQEKDALLQQIQNYSLSSNKSKELGMTIFELAQRAPELYKRATLEEKRKLIYLVFGLLVIDDGQIHFEYTEPFKILANAVETTNSSKAFKSIKSPVWIFEPQEKSSTKASLSDLETVCPTLLPNKDSNLDTWYQKPVSYH